MVNKLLIFCTILLIAFTLFLTGSFRTSFECSSIDNKWTCNIYKNNILSQNPKPINTLSFYNILTADMQCLYLNDFGTEQGKFYLLRKTDDMSTYFMKNKSFNSYNSKKVCEIDKAAFNTFFTTKGITEFKYTSTMELLNYLWYLLSVVFILFGIFILFVKFDKYKK